MLTKELCFDWTHIYFNLIYFCQPILAIAISQSISLQQILANNLRYSKNIQDPSFNRWWIHYPIAARYLVWVKLESHCNICLSTWTGSIALNAANIEKTARAAKIWILNRHIIAILLQIVCDMFTIWGLAWTWLYQHLSTDDWSNRNDSWETFLYELSV